MSSIVVTQAELEAPRTSRDFLSWVHAAHARFNTKALKQAAREGKYFAGELMDEALPIGLFAQRYFAASTLVTIQHVIGNQNYDAIVTDQRPQPSPVKFIEVTLADFDRDMALRMEILNRDGHVPMLGPINVEGPRHHRKKLEAVGIAEDHDKVVDEHLARAVNAVKRKAAKTYPPGTALVVRVDDSIPFRVKDDVETLEQLAQQVLVPLASGCEFVVLAFVGGLGLYLEFPL